MKKYADATEQKNNYRFLINQITCSRLFIYFSIFLAFALSFSIALQAYFLANIIYATVIQHKTLHTIEPYLLYFISAIILRSVIVYTRNWLNYYCSAQIKKNLRTELIDQIKNSGPIRLNHFSSGTLLTCVIEHVESLDGFLSNYFPQLLLVMIIPISLLILIFIVNWIAGLILFITAPLIPLFMALIGKGAQSLANRQVKQLSEMSGYFLDLLKGITTLKLFQSTTDQVKKINQISHDYRIKTMKVLKVAFLSSAVLELFSATAIAILAVYLGLTLLGLIHYSHQSLSLGTALFMLLLAPELFLPLRQLGAFYHEKSNSIAAISEIRTILSISNSKKAVSSTNAIQDKIKTKAPNLNNHFNITFDQVSFAYLSKKPCLKQISFSISSNEKIAITGKSGVGKSTLLYLLCQFILPDAGTIKINATNLSKVDTQQWQKQIAWVGPEAKLIQGSIRENFIASAGSNSTQEINHILKLMQLDGLIDTLPEGLDTYIYEENSGLSAGEKQRIALCCAYLKDTPLLLLDEPTAYLDPKNESIILSGLKKIIKNKTVILISHKNNPLNLVDRIYHLDQTGILYEKK